MTVKELKELLSKQNDNDEVCYEYADNDSTIINGRKLYFTKPKKELNNVEYNIDIRFEISKNKVENLKIDAERLDELSAYS